MLWYLNIVSVTEMHCLPELVVSGRVSLLTGFLHVCAKVTQLSMPLLTYQKKSSEGSLGISDGSPQMRLEVTQ